MRQIFNWCAAYICLITGIATQYTHAVDKVNFTKVTGHDADELANDYAYKGGVLNESGKRTSKEFEGEEPLDMPYIGNISEYEDIASNPQNWYDFTSESNGYTKVVSHGSLSVWDPKKDNGKGGYVDLLANGVYQGNGPDGIADTFDDDSLLIIGTPEKPIKIEGVVVVKGDLIIGGNYEGTGVVYTGRNVHIVSNLQGNNTANWDRSESADKGQQMIDNYNTDLIGLFAKGNVILGNPKNASTAYMDTTPYIIDPSDADLGYSNIASDENGSPMFNGNYHTADGLDWTEPVPDLNNMTSLDTDVNYGAEGDTYYLNVRFLPHEDPTSVQIGAGIELKGDATYRTTVRERYWNGRRWKYRNVEKLVTETGLTEDYTIIGYKDVGGGNFKVELKPSSTNNKLISESTSGIQYKCRISGVKQQKVISKYYMPRISQSILDSLPTANLTNIDAIMYTNHYLGGNVGALTMTGALICRDEGIRFSNYITMNWNPLIAYGPIRSMLPTTPVPPKMVYIEE